MMQIWIGLLADQKIVFGMSSKKMWLSKCYDEHSPFILKTKVTEEPDFRLLYIFKNN